jgi:hypothetical protein
MELNFFDFLPIAMKLNWHARCGMYPRLLH